ncbi:hypothetical protein ABIB27_001361 [Arthrobacter sp. UYEF21]
MTGSPEQDHMTQDELDLVDRWWRGANYLSVGQIYLRSNPLLREPLAADHTRSRLLGHWGDQSGPELCLRPLEPRGPAGLPGDALRCRPRPWWAGRGGERLAGGDLLRNLWSRGPGRGGDGRAVPPVFVSRWHSQPCGAGDPRVHQRGRRTGVRAGPRLRVCVRQSQADHHRRNGRRRSGNGAARGELALTQRPGPGPRWRRAALRGPAGSWRC